jgi:hypothetical protein
MTLGACQSGLGACRESLGTSYLRQNKPTTHPLPLLPLIQRRQGGHDLHRLHVHPPSKPTSNSTSYLQTAFGNEGRFCNEVFREPMAYEEKWATSAEKCFTLRDAFHDTSTYSESE